MQQKQSKMGVMPIPKLLLTMAIPLMLSLLVQSLYNMRCGNIMLPDRTE